MSNNCCTCKYNRYYYVRGIGSRSYCDLLKNDKGDVVVDLAGSCDKHEPAAIGVLCDRLRLMEGEAGNDPE